jgi:hypothetical protein
MPWSTDEVETILAQMRAGATVQTGGSRCHTTYFFAAGEWGYEDFDEGATHQGRCSEPEIRAMIASQPELFRSILHAVPWQRFSTAFVAGDRQAAREHLRAAVVYGDPLGHAAILDAVLAWPESEPDPRVLAAIRDDLSGFTAWHVFMDAVRWDRSPASGTLGLAYCDTLAAMLAGPAIGWHYLRAAFHELRNDFDAAADALARELELLPPEHHNRVYVEQQLMRVHARARANPGPSAGA